MAAARRQTARGLAVLPLLLMGALHFGVPPLRGTFELEPRLMWVWYGMALGLGFVLFRRSRVVKDHEYNRAQAMRSVRHVYKAEAEGVWDSNVVLDGTLADAGPATMNRSVGALAPEIGERELEGEDKVEVTVLTSARHIVAASGRAAPGAGVEAAEVDRTLGAEVKQSPMDRLLDTVWGLFGRDTRAEREALRQARMQARSSAAPVIAQRPVAPIRTSTSSDNEEVQLTSMSDSGGVETVLDGRGAERVEFNDTAFTAPAPPMTLEEMAGFQPANRPSTSGPHCRGCGGSAPQGTAYCPHCGLDL